MRNEPSCAGSPDARRWKRRGKSLPDLLRFAEITQISVSSTVWLLTPDPCMYVEWELLANLGSGLSTSNPEYFTDTPHGQFISELTVESACRKTEFCFSSMLVFLPLLSLVNVNGNFPIKFLSKILLSFVSAEIVCNYLTRELELV